MLLLLRRNLQHLYHLRTLLGLHGRRRIRNDITIPAIVQKLTQQLIDVVITRLLPARMFNIRRFHHVFHRLRFHRLRRVLHRLRLHHGRGLHQTFRLMRLRQHFRRHMHVFHVFLMVRDVHRGLNGRIRIVVRQIFHRLYLVHLFDRPNFRRHLLLEPGGRVIAIFVHVRSWHEYRLPVNRQLPVTFQLLELIRR